MSSGLAVARAHQVRPSVVGTTWHTQHGASRWCSPLVKKSACQCQVQAAFVSASLGGQGLPAQLHAECGGRTRLAAVVLSVGCAGTMAEGTSDFCEGLGRRWVWAGGCCRRRWTKGTWKSGHQGAGESWAFPAECWGPSGHLLRETVCLFRTPCSPSGPPVGLGAWGRDDGK